MNPLTISRLNAKGLITNYPCPSACRHCLYQSSPRWPKEFISAEMARRNLEAIQKLGCSSIHLGGGEPLREGEYPLLSRLYAHGIGALLS